MTTPDDAARVPREPTPEMLRAGGPEGGFEPQEYYVVKDIWTAMLAAAQPRSAQVVVDEANFRKEFERWLSKRHGYSTERWADSGEYHSHNTRSYWQAWNAALTAALNREEG